MLLFEILQFQKFNDFRVCKTWEFFEIFKIENFWNFPIWTFFEIPKLEIFRIFLIANFWNCLNWKINKLLEFIQFRKSKIGSEDWQFWNYSSIRYSALLAILPFLEFTDLLFDINKFSQFLFPILVTRKFGRSTFERS